LPYPESARRHFFGGLETHPPVVKARARSVSGSADEGERRPRGRDEERVRASRSYEYVFTDEMSNESV
jgi:hypothetical protein